MSFLQGDYRAWFLVSRAVTQMRLPTTVVPHRLPFGLPRVWRFRPDVKQYACVYERIQ